MRELRACKVFQRPLAPSSAQMLSSRLKFPSRNLKRMRTLIRGSRSNQAWQSQSWPTQPLLGLRTLSRVHGIFPHWLPERGLQQALMLSRHPERSHFQPCLLSHPLGAHWQAQRSVCMCVRAHTLVYRKIMQILRVVPGSGANWHVEGTYAKSHSTWPLNLDNLSLSCTRGAFFFHAVV